jgi:hypothetical protein
MARINFRARDEGDNLMVGELWEIALDLHSSRGSCSCLPRRPSKRVVWARAARYSSRAMYLSVGEGSGSTPYVYSLVAHTWISGAAK